MNSDSISRRGVLEVAGVGLVAGLNSVSAVSATSGDPEKSGGKDETNNPAPFDPSNTSEVVQWVQQLNSSSATPEKRLKALNRAQKEAVLDVTATQRIEVTDTQASQDGAVGTQSYPYSDKTVTRAVAGYAAVGKVWQFNHEVYFEYNGANDVRNIDSRAWGNTYYFTWFYRGSDGSARDEGDTFNAFKQGTFENCVTQLGCFQQQNPWIEIWGNYTGSVFWDHSG